MRIRRTCVCLDGAALALGLHAIIPMIAAVALVPVGAPHVASAESNDAPHTEMVVSQGPDHRVRYMSGHTLCVEALRDGHWIVAFRSGDGRINMPSEVWSGDAFALEIDHERLDSGWEWVSFEQPDATHHGVVELRHPSRAIRLRLHTELDGTPVMTRWLEITNESSKPVAITAVSPWGGRLSRGESWQLGYYRKDDHNEEGWFEWSALPRWHTTISSIKGQGHDAPFFVLRNDASGEYFIGSLAWSANWRLYFLQDPRGVVTFEFGPNAEAPLRIVAPGETVRSPALHLGHLSGDLDDAAQAMHAHVRRSVLPPTPETRGLVQYRVPADQGYHMPFNEETARENVDMAAAIGAELFILDTYWWDVTCDWYPSKERFPNGIESLIAYVREKGMRFGLYTEAEGGRGNIRESAVAREHPDWLGPKDVINLARISHSLQRDFVFLGSFSV